MSEGSRNKLLVRGVVDAVLLPEEVDARTNFFLRTMYSRGAAVGPSPIRTSFAGIFSRTSARSQSPSVSHDGDGNSTSVTFTPCAHH